MKSGSIRLRLRQTLNAFLPSAARLRNWLVVILLVVAAITTIFIASADISLSTSTASTQNFDSIGTAATATLPTDFRVDKPATVRTVGTYAAALTATSLAGGNSLSTTAQNGIYNFGAGVATSATDRAIGFLSSGTATSSGNLYANLGFNVYREFDGQRVRINSSLIAGTALMVGKDVSVQAGYTYNWIDDVTDSNASYWIEDVDLNGNSIWHGPFGISSSSTRPITQTKSALLSNWSFAK